VSRSVGRHHLEDFVGLVVRVQDLDGADAVRYRAILGEVGIHAAGAGHY